MPPKLNHVRCHASAFSFGRVAVVGADDEACAGPAVGVKRISKGW